MTELKQKRGAATVAPRKVAAVQVFTEQIKEVPTVLFADYRGLTVEQISGLRAKLRGNQTVFRVVKNAVAKIAFRDLKMEGLDDYLEGPTAVAFVSGDVSVVSKALLDFGRQLSIGVKGGYVDGQALNQADVAVLSSLPGKDQLYAILLGTLQAPVRNLAYVLQAVMSGLVRTLQAVADKQSSAD
jgi:large subunit ribosomal protein L10